MLYGVNTAGAALGVLLVTFGLLPRLGVELTAMLMTGLNLTVALIAYLIRAEEPADEPAPAAAYEAATEEAPDAPVRLPSRVAGYVRS